MLKRLNTFYTLKKKLGTLFQPQQTKPCNKLTNKPLYQRSTPKKHVQTQTLIIITSYTCRLPQSYNYESQFHSQNVDPEQLKFKHVIHEQYIHPVQQKKQQNKLILSRVIMNSLLWVFMKDLTVFQRLDESENWIWHVTTYCYHHHPDHIKLNRYKMEL